MWHLSPILHLALLDTLGPHARDMLVEKTIVPNAHAAHQYYFRNEATSLRITLGRRLFEEVARIVRLTLQEARRDPKERGAKPGAAFLGPSQMAPHQDGGGDLRHRLAYGQLGTPSS